MIDIYGSHYEIIHCIECLYVLVHWRAGLKNNNFIGSQPKHVVDAQKNRLNETVLLSNQNLCKKIFTILR